MGGFSIFSSNGRKAYGINNYIVDTPDDIDKLPKDCHPGCMALAISNTSYYMMNHQKTWVKLNFSSGGGNTAPVNPGDFDDDTLVIYDGNEET